VKLRSLASQNSTENVSDRAPRRSDKAGSSSLVPGNHVQPSTDVDASRTTYDLSVEDDDAPPQKLLRLQQPAYVFIELDD